MIEFSRRFFASEFFRYIVSGCIAFICDFSVLVLLTEYFEIHYLLSNIAGYAVGLVVSYLINILWVFEHRKFNDRQSQEFIYFTLIVFVGLAISEGVLWIATESGEVQYMISKIIATFFVFLFNFVVKKWLLFPTPAQSA